MIYNDYYIMVLGGCVQNNSSGFGCTEETEDMAWQ